MLRDLATVLFLLLAAAAATAQTTMPEAVVSAGGTDMRGSHLLRGTLSQSIGGRAVGLSYYLEIGFWHSFWELVSTVPPPPDYVWGLKGNYPNPFNPRTTIAFSLPDRSRITLRVYDLRGALVATLVDREMPAGGHTAVWDGRDARGAGMASGVYLARIESRHGVLTRKLALVR